MTHLTRFALLLVLLSFIIDCNAQIGSSSVNPAASCWHIKTATPSATSSTYWIKPTNYAGSAFQGYCDMTTDGGGWLLVANQVPNNNNFSFSTPSSSMVSMSQTVNGFFTQTILNSLATEGSFYQVMVEETSTSSPDKTNGLVMVYRLNSSTTVKFAAANSAVSGAQTYVFTTANAQYAFLTPTGYVTVIDNARDTGDWWGLSTHGAAFGSLASASRCLKKNNFADTNTGAINGDYKLDHNPIAFPSHTGTTRCLHVVTTYGVTHWIRPTISCSSNVTTPIFVSASSGIVDPNALKLVFNTNPSRTTTFAFLDQANATCGNTAASTYWSTTLSGCDLRYTVTIPFNTALTECGFKRSEDVVVNGDTFTRFDATVTIKSFQTVSTIRGIVVNSTLNTAVTVYVLINNAINVTSTSLSVFGPRITLARITSQTVNTSPATPVFTLNLFTSAQWPYQFITPTINNVAGFSASITAVSSGACNPATANQPCGQNWQITISRSSACPTYNNINNNGWTVNFGVQCQSIFTGSCSTPSLNTDSVTFDTASDDYCPRLLETESSTATMTVYSNAAFSAVQNQFVFGARSYFEAIINSPIVLTSVALERVTITSGAAGGSSLIVYQNTFTSAATYKLCDVNGCPTGNFMTFNNSITSLQVTDNVSATGAGAGYFRAARFSWIWSSQTSSANADASVSTLVQVNLRLRYANQSTVSVPITIMNNKQEHKVHLAETTSATIASASVDIIGAVENNNAGDNNTPIVSTGTAAAGSASLTSLNIIAIVAGVVGVIALVAAAVVGVRLRNTQFIKAYPSSTSMESVNAL